ncbi:hypothetical protein Emag_004655 [Eimeria magna]
MAARATAPAAAAAELLEDCCQEASAAGRATVGRGSVVPAAGASAAGRGGLNKRISSRQTLEISSSESLGFLAHQQGVFAAVTQRLMNIQLAVVRPECSHVDNVARATNSSLHCRQASLQVLKARAFILPS